MPSLVINGVSYELPPDDSQAQKVPAYNAALAALAALAGNSGAAWVSWTPTWTGLTLGNGTVVAKYTQIGKKVTCRLSLAFGSTTAVTGDVQFTLPVTRAVYGGTDTVTPLGEAIFFDSGVAAVQGCTVNHSTTKAAFRVFTSNQTYVVHALVSSTAPHTWGTGDEMATQFSYEAA